MEQGVERPPIALSPEPLNTHILIWRLAYKDEHISVEISWFGSICHSVPVTEDAEFLFYRKVFIKIMIFFLFISLNHPQTCSLYL